MDAYQASGGDCELLHFALVRGRVSAEQRAIRERLSDDAGHRHVGQQHELLHQLIRLPLHCSTCRGCDDTTICHTRDNAVLPLHCSTCRGCDDTIICHMRDNAVLPLHCSTCRGCDDTILCHMQDRAILDMDKDMNIAWHLQDATCWLYAMTLSFQPSVLAPVKCPQTCFKTKLFDDLHAGYQLPHAKAGAQVCVLALSEERCKSSMRTMGVCITGIAILI